MQKWNTVAIVGVGLIGGSIGLALQQRGLADRIIGIGRRASSLRRAQQCGAIHAASTDLARGVADAELIIVCTPVAIIAEHVTAAAQHCPSGALITDVGSTKANIVASLDGNQAYWREGVQFVGSHPLAGSDKTGAEHARADLLETRTVVVTPTRRTPAKTYERLASFWESLGARVVRHSPATHDRLLAATSHLPHLAASAVAAATPRDALPLAATGWLDTTRIAAGNADLWMQILLDNRLHVLQALDKFEKVLTDFRKALSDEDAKRLIKLLEAGRRNRDAVGN